MTNKNTKPSLELEPLEQGSEKQRCLNCGHGQYELAECERCGEKMNPRQSNKLLLTTAFFLLILAISLTLIIKNKDGNTIISLDKNNFPQFTQPDWLTTSHEIKDLLNEGKSQINSNVSIHKWQDKNGVWHYSQQAPSGQIDGNGKSEVINIDLETNIIPHQ